MSGNDELIVLSKLKLDLDVEKGNLIDLDNYLRLKNKVHKLEADLNNLTNKFNKFKGFVYLSLFLYYVFYFIYSSLIYFYF